MPISEGSYTESSINYSMNVTTRGGLSVQVMFSGFGVDEEVADVEFQSLTDLLSAWSARNPNVPITAQKFINWMYQATPTGSNGGEELPPPPDGILG